MLFFKEWEKEVLSGWVNQQNVNPHKYLCRPITQRKPKFRVLVSLNKVIMITTLNRKERGSLLATQTQLYESRDEHANGSGPTQESESYCDV